MFNDYKIEAEEKEINLDNPIFVYYIDTRGITRQRLVEEANQIIRVFPKNVTLWIVPSEQPSKIECVYDGQCRNRDMEISDLIKEINTRIDIMSNSHSFDDFKINIRDWRLSELINGSEEK